ncbi:MAG: hypothetical protein Q4A05_03215 [Ruminococcus sp.]|nr:hypothetical protein [Ruminococcus sp.]
MSKNSENTALRFRQSPFSAAVMTVLSLFCQFLDWFAFEKIGYPWWVALITPLLLCAMYHFVQLDAGGNSGYSRIFVFIFSAAVPLLLGIFVTVAVYLGDPQISTFSADREYTGTVRELISLYSGRIAVTSAYLCAFALVDVPVLKACDKARR